ncbi:hypothetical protein LXL04_004675 [Taraxacum kok-saghyz]
MTSQTYTHEYHPWNDTIEVRTVDVIIIESRKAHIMVLAPDTKIDKDNHRIPDIVLTIILTRNSPLADRFPRLYKLEKLKSCSLKDRMVDGSFEGAWKKRPNGVAELADLRDLTSSLPQMQLSDGPDSWISLLAPDGSFAVRDFRALIDLKITTAALNPAVWIHLVPIKVNCFVWRTCLDRIPTSTALALRGVHMTSTDCASCSSGLDDVDHILVDCPIAKDLLIWIFRWCEISMQNFSKAVDLVDFAASWGRCPKKRKILVAIIYGFIWSIWKARNDKIFNNIPISVGNLKDNIVSLGISEIVILQTGVVPLLKFCNFLFLLPCLIADNNKVHSWKSTTASSTASSYSDVFSLLGNIRSAIVSLSINTVVIDHIGIGFVCRSSSSLYSRCLSPDSSATP